MAVDLTRLAEAVDVGRHFPAPSLIADLVEGNQALLAAPRVWWCAEHKASWPDSSVDYCHATFDDGETCRMVRVAVVPVEE